MTIKDLSNLLIELNLAKKLGGSKYKQANSLLNSEATTVNIEQAVQFISDIHSRK